ncbi:hypothetical protein PCANC_22667 [Puccinia coronata f. sp. avenae]|uniref:Uncharacterized protein n=1 Tax=Puccinia coronata f. sp. avenae TaxID=200324 RepID=A0A2N5TVR2_9BASI|nr:hypothetical protein PCANC_22667 [Puccinia coronata f. sp. avenae]
MLPNDENDVSQHLAHNQQITQDLLAKDEVVNILLEMSDSSSNDNQSKKPRRPNKERLHEENHERLMADYFNPNCTYNSCDFSRRYQIERHLFLRILEDITSQFPYFLRKPVRYFAASHSKNHT